MAVKKTEEAKTAAEKKTAAKTVTAKKPAAKKAAAPKKTAAKAAADKKPAAAKKAAAPKTSARKTSSKKVAEAAPEETRTLFDPVIFRRELDTYLTHTLHTDFENAPVEDLYQAVATLVDRELGTMRTAYNEERFEREKQNEHRKKICYICMEFLMGQSLKNNLYNLGQTELVASIMKERGVSMEELYAAEPDAGLGNGGLGRLAACFMDALTTCGYDATGYSLCYEYGLFKQKIVDGWQVEMPDNWLPGGRVWLNQRHEDSFKVNFYGEYNEYWADDGLHYELHNPQVVDHHDPVGKGKRFLLIMGDIHHCDIQLFLDLLQLGTQCQLDLRIQRRHGFVKKDHIRIQHQRSRDRHTLLLPAGELFGFFIDMFFQPDRLDHLHDFPVDLLFPELSGLKRISNVMVDVHIREE